MNIQDLSDDDLLKSLNEPEPAQFQKQQITSSIQDLSDDELLKSINEPDRPSAEINQQNANQEPINTSMVIGAPGALIAPSLQMNKGVSAGMAAAAKDMPSMATEAINTAGLGIPKYLTNKIGGEGTYPEAKTGAGKIFQNVGGLIGMAAPFTAAERLTKGLISGAGRLKNIARTGLSGALVGALETPQESQLSGEGFIDPKERAKQAALYGGTGAVLSGIGETLGAAQRRFLPTQKQLIADRVKELSKIESDYGKVRKSVNKSESRGFDPKTELAKTDLLQGAVTDKGTLDTTNAIKKFNEQISPVEDVVSKSIEKEGAVIKISDLEKGLKDAVLNSNLEGAALDVAMSKIDKELSGLRLRMNQSGEIPLSRVHKAKTTKYATIDYLNPEGAKADKVIAKGLKEVVEKNSSADIKKINDDLSKLYSIQDLLEKLNGKKVEGGRLGKYFAKSIGAIAGHPFGPLGTWLGAELGGWIKGEQMASTFGKGGGSINIPDGLVKAAKEANTPRKVMGLLPRSTETSTPAVMQMQRPIEVGVNSEKYPNVMTRQVPSVPGKDIVVAGPPSAGKGLVSLKKPVRPAASGTVDAEYENVKPKGLLANPNKRNSSPVALPGPKKPVMAGFSQDQMKTKVGFRKNPENLTKNEFIKSYSMNDFVKDMGEGSIEKIRKMKDPIKFKDDFLSKEWDKAVEKAIRDGKNVPDKVLEGHPELKILKGKIKIKKQTEMLENMKKKLQSNFL